MIQLVPVPARHGTTWRKRALDHTSVGFGVVRDSMFRRADGAKGKVDCAFTGTEDHALCKGAWSPVEVGECAQQHGHLTWP